MRRTVFLIATLCVLLSEAACAPQLQSAVQIGDREPATWVFIAVADRSYQGVYRCKETEEGPVCQKAKIKD